MDTGTNEMRVGCDMKGDHCDAGVIVECYTHVMRTESLPFHSMLHLICIALLVLQQEVLSVQEDSGIKPGS